MQGNPGHNTSDSCLKFFTCSMFGRITRPVPFFRLCIWSIACLRVCSVISDSLQPHGLYSLPGFSIHGIFQARILEWVAVSSSRGSSQPRGGTHVSCVSCIGREILCPSTTCVAPLLLFLALHLWATVANVSDQFAEGACTFPKTPVIRGYYWLQIIFWGCNVQHGDYS